MQRGLVDSSNPPRSILQQAICLLTLLLCQGVGLYHRLASFRCFASTCWPACCGWSPSMKFRWWDFSCASLTTSLLLVLLLSWVSVCGPTHPLCRGRYRCCWMGIPPSTHCWSEVFSVACQHGVLHSEFALAHFFFVLVSSNSLLVSCESFDSSSSAMFQMRRSLHCHYNQYSRFSLTLLKPLFFPALDLTLLLSSLSDSSASSLFRTVCRCQTRLTRKCGKLHQDMTAIKCSKQFRHFQRPKGRFGFLRFWTGF